MGLLFYPLSLKRPLLRPQKSYNGTVGSDRQKHALSRDTFIFLFVLLPGLSEILFRRICHLYFLRYQFHIGGKWKPTHLSTARTYTGGTYYHEDADGDDDYDDADDDDDDDVDAHLS